MESGLGVGRIKVEPGSKAGAGSPAGGGDARTNGASEVRREGTERNAGITSVARACCRKPRRNMHKGISWVLGPWL